MKKFMKFIVRKIPRPYLIKFSGLFTKIVSPFYRGHNVKCPVCEHEFRKFLPYGNQGADNRLCPYCLTLERHRLLWLYLKDKTNLFTDKLKVLHIAPEQPFIKRFRSMENLDYYTADLESPLADIKLDIRNMPLEDESFDVVICNHVLEHIDDDIKAMKEIYRVLRKGGWAILQVPVNYNREKTFEDPAITDPKERERLFGQYDHVREYGRDYPDRLASVGFKVREDDYIKTLKPELIEFYRLDPDEKVYYCEKLK